MEKKYFRIHPLLTCKMKHDKGMFTYLRNHGERILVPTWAWLILGEEPILVDTGCSVEDFLKYSVLSFGGEAGPSIEDSLRKFDLSVLDIKTIIMTHLHSDHCLNAKKFPNARIIVQEEELKFAMNPHPLFSKTSNKEWYDGLTFEAIRGDSEIIPGIKTLFTPGHTAGSQSVSISSEHGEVVITGFCVLDDNFSDKEDIIPSIHIDPLRAYDSMVKIRKIADTIIPLHSERILNVSAIP